MRKSLFVILVLLGCSHTLFGQIKIGDNPEAIDPSSVLELESTDRVLVITRINTEQMNAITPSFGALIYNTDENCIFYFNGTEWLNLCASLGLSLTAEALVNEFPTIVLTENGAQTNIEVGEIRGDNIVDFSISAADIQNNSITADKLAPSSVGVEELQDNTVADAEIDYNQVTLADFVNDAGYITLAEIVSAASGNDIVDNGGAFYDDSGLQSDIAANTAAIAADGDTDSSNEIQTLAITGNQLDITGGNSVDLSVFNNTGTDDQTLNLSGTTLSIEDGNNVDLGMFNNSGTDDQNLSLSGNVLSIEDGNNVDLTPILGGGGTDDQNLSLAGNTITIEDGNSIDLTPILGGGGTDDQQLSLTGNTLTLEDGGTVNLASFLDNTDNQNLTGATLDAANELTIDIENGNSVTVDLSSLAGAGTDDQVAAEVEFTPAGNTASVHVQAAIEELQTEIDGISSGGAANPNDELITSFALNGTGLDIAEGANILPTVDLNATFATDAELAAISVDDADADPGNEITTVTDNLDGTTTILDVNGGNVTVDNDGIDNIDDADSDPNNEIELPVGGASGEVLSTDGAGAYSWVSNSGGGVIVSSDAPNSITSGSDGGAIYNDLDSDPNNEITTVTDNLDGTTTILDVNGGNVTVDNDGIDNVDDADSDPNNEIELPAGGASGEVLSTDGAGAYSWVSNSGGGVIVSSDAPNSITSGSDGGAIYNDLDSDPNNEITTVTDNLDGTTTILDVNGGNVTVDNDGIDNVDDADPDPNNEIELPAGGASGEVLSTDGAGTYSWVSNSGGSIQVDLSTIVGDGTGGNPLSVPTNGITTTQIADGTISTSDMGVGSVTGGAGGIIADDSITASDLQADSVDSQEIRIDAVGTSELAPDAVTTVEILNGTILNEDISNSAAIAGTKINPDFGPNDVTTNGVFISGGTTLTVPDYVFEKFFTGNSEVNKDYELMSLFEINKFIRKYKHLPGIPSALDVKESGIWNLTEASLNNLEKIEELFLHTIEQENKIQALSEKNAALQKELDRLSKEMELIKTIIKENAIDE